MTAETFIDRELAAFIEGGVSVLAASRDGERIPNLARAVGCRVSHDRTRVTLFLLASKSAALLADFRANGAIAVVFSQPSSHRTVQLKGTDASVVPVEEGDAVRIARYREAFVGEIASIGWEPSLPATLVAGARGDVVAVAFTVTAAFVQTPGPAAGTPLKA